MPASVAPRRGHTASARRPASELLTGGERRSLSVLVLDVAGSTALTSRLDPEDFEEILERLGSVWSAAIEEFGGSVLKWTGDGLIAVFGYPRAHDNDAVRAVAAGLRILELSERERATGRRTPAVRLGLHTGLTLIHRLRTGDSEHLDITGDTPMIATRLEGLAPLNGMVVSAVTAGLAEREFEFESVGPHILKGLDRPVDVTRVLRRRELVELDDSEHTRLLRALVPHLIGRRR